MAATGTGSLTNSSSAGSAGPPFTLAAWINLPATNPSGQTDSFVWALFDKSDGSNSINLHFAGTFGSYIFGSVAQTLAGQTIDCTMASNVPSPGSGWFHVAAVFPSTAGNINSISIYCNGTLNNTVSAGGPVIDWSPADATKMEMFFGNVNGNAFCTLAYPSAWNIALTSAQIAQLATMGTDPSTVQTANLISYAPLQSSNMTVDKVAGAFVISGTVTNAADPFTITSGTAPTVTFSSATAITTTSCTLHGSITALGSANSTIVGFNYGTTTAYGSTVQNTGSFAVGAFSINVTGLTAGTVYDFQAFATNPSGTGTSANSTFTTAGGTGTTWVSNGQQTGGSGAYSPGTQSVNFILASFPVQTGDTITIPAGTFTWATTTTIPLGITLSGVNPGVTGNSSGAEASFTSIILNNVATGIMLTAVAPSTGHITIAYICFKQNVSNTGGAGYCLQLDRSDFSGGALVKSPYTCLVHDCIFDCLLISSYMIQCLCNGVIIWQCTFTASASSNLLSGVQHVPAKYGPTLDWNTPDTMGLTATAFGVGDTASGYAQVAGLNNSYIETCTFFQLPSACVNADSNSRIVVRNCKMTDSALLIHGSTSQYAVRHSEFYSNQFLNVNSQSLNVQGWVAIRSGTLILYNNSMAAPPAGKFPLILFLENVNRSDYSGAGAAQTSYPASRQISIGWSAAASASNIPYGFPAVASFGVGQQLNPLYIWNNTGFTTSTPSTISIDQFTPDTFGNNLTVSGTVFFNQQTSAIASGSVTSLAATFAGTINGSTVFGSWLHDLLLCMVSWTTSGTPSVTVTDGTNTYSQVGTTFNASTGHSQAIFAAINKSATCTFTVTAHFSTAVSGLSMNIADYAGNWIAANEGVITTDGSNNNSSSSSTSLASGSITTTLGADLVIAWVDSASTVTGLASGWTQRAYDGTNFFGFFDNISTLGGTFGVPGAFQLTGTTSDPWIASVVAFKSMPFMANNRDFIVGTPYPSWTQYTYPHPLTTGVVSFLPPTVPTAASATPASTTAITVNWTLSSDTQIGMEQLSPANVQYPIEHMGGSISKFTQIAGTPVSGFTGATGTFSDTGLTPSTLYTYQMRSQDNVPNISAYTASFTATTNTPVSTPPNTPTLSSAIATSATQVTLSWPATTDPNFASNLLTYLIFRAVTPGTPIQVATTAAGILTYNDAGLTQLTQYTYFIEAENPNSNISGASNSINVTTFPSAAAPVLVQSIGGSAATGTTVSASFTNVQGSGNSNIVVVGWRNATSAIVSVVDNAGNTYVPVTGTTAANGVSQAIYICPSIVPHP